MSMEMRRSGRAGTAIMDYLGCECSLFPPMTDDGPIIAAYRRAREEGVRGGFWPMLVKPDEILLECLVMNACPGCKGRNGSAFDRKKAAQYRAEALSLPLAEGKALLEELLGRRRRNAAASGLDWEKDVLAKWKAAKRTTALGAAGTFSAERPLHSSLRRYP